MAVFEALQKFNLLDVNLNFYVEEYYNDGFIKDRNLNFFGTVYKDYYWINGYDGVADTQLEFLGSEFSRNVSGAFTGGTVNVVVEFDISNDIKGSYIRA